MTKKIGPKPPKGTPKKAKGEGAGSHWNITQNCYYLWFLMLMGTIFESQAKRREEKIFQMMSKFIPIKNPTQCRVHSQKLWNKKKSLQKTINSLIKQNYRDRQIPVEHMLGEIKNYLATLTLHPKDKELFYAQLEKLPSRLPSIPGEVQQIQSPEVFLSPNDAYEHIYEREIFGEDFSVKESESFKEEPREENNEKNKKKNKDYKWKPDEILRFYWGMELQRERMTQQQPSSKDFNINRKNKTFKVLSKFVKSKDPNQCRSRHQKMLENFKSNDKLISNCRKNYYFQRDLGLDHFEKEVKTHIQKQLMIPNIPRDEAIKLGQYLKRLPNIQWTETAPQFSPDSDKIEFPTHSRKFSSETIQLNSPISSEISLDYATATDQQMFYEESSLNFPIFQGISLDRQFLFQTEQE